MNHSGYPGTHGQMGGIVSASTLRIQKHGRLLGMGLLQAVAVVHTETFQPGGKVMVKLANGLVFSCI